MMILKTIEVIKLFNRYNHTITLNQEDRITIINGPNGVGKTSIFKLLHALYSRDYSDIYTIPFRELLLTFDTDMSSDDDECFISIKKNQENRTIELSSHEIPPECEDYTLNYQKLMESTEFSQSKHFLHQRSIHNQRGFFFKKTGDSEERKDEYVNYIANDYTREKEKENNIKSVVHRLCFYKYPIQYISTDRLQSQRDEDKLSVDELNQYFHRRVLFPMLRALDEYQQGRDSTFPSRLIKKTRSTSTPPSKKQLSKKYSEIQEKSQLLHNILAYPGNIDDELSQMIEREEEKIDAKVRIVLGLLFEDELKTLDEWIAQTEKIRVLLDNIANLFEDTGKRIKIDKLRGFVLDTGDSLLPLNRLSSGEQHEFVMNYNLIFHKAPSRLVLIDEPEISLHTVWQREFIGSLMRIADLNPEICFIVSTHSPSIAGNYKHLHVNLSPSPSIEESGPSHTWAEEYESDVDMWDDDDSK
jgi:predicted ATP-binding protein involved in virulence